MKIFIIILLALSITLLTTQQQMQTQPISKKSKISTNQLELLVYQLFSNNQCLLPPVPQKFGMVTMTRLRTTGESDLGQAIDIFKQYLKRYAQMQCDAFDSIYIIWNNDKAPEEYPGLLEDRAKWKKNVYFLHTQFNSLDHRFIIPPWVQEEAFYTLDDDILIDCEGLKKSLKIWQQHVVGGLGPLSSPWLSSRTIQYNFKTDKFEYLPKVKSYSSISLTGFALAPRHFHNLYYADIPEFHQVRKIIKEYFNCEDIGLNYMIDYLYPQMRPLLLKDVEAKFKKIDNSIHYTAVHKSKRDDCVNKFSEIFGEMALPYKVINQSQKYQKIREDPLRKHHCMLALKKNLIEQKYFNYEHYYQNIKQIYVYNSSVLDPEYFKKIQLDNYMFTLDEISRKIQLGERSLTFKFKSNQFYSEQEFQDVSQLKDRVQMLQIMFILSTVLLIWVTRQRVIQCIKQIFKRGNHQIKGKDLYPVDAYANEMTQVQSGQLSKSPQQENNL